MFKPEYAISNKLLACVENITELKVIIELSTKQIKWIPRLSREALIKTIHSSTAIEGNPLNEKEVAMVVGGEKPGYLGDREVKEIINYLEALRYIEKNSAVKKLDEKQVLQLHKIIGKKNALDRGPVGAYRGYLVKVGRYIAPDAKLVQKKMQEMLQWLEKEGEQLSPVISSAIVHHQFEAIHPFGDGNGRVGRLLALWILYQRGFDKHHIFSIDEFYLEQRDRYYKELQSVHDRKNDLTKWIEFVAEGINHTLNKTMLRIKATTGGSDKGDKIILTKNQERILNLLRVGDMSTNEIRENIGVSRQGVWFLMKPLMDHKIVAKVGDKKTGKYRLL